MSRIVNLRTFNQAQLLHLLYECSHLLDDAYQETMLHEFHDVACEASMACEYLRCEMATQNPSFRLQ